MEMIIPIVSLFMLGGLSVVICIQISKYLKKAVAAVIYFAEKIEALAILRNASKSHTARF